MKAYLWRILLWIDCGVNVLLGPLLNLLLVRTGGHQFGHDRETLSSVMGKNARDRRQRCRACDWICRHILHPIDPGHCVDAIEPEGHDQ